MLTTRERATALLDVLGHREPHDRTAEAVAKARSFRATTASGLYDADALQWAWADTPEPLSAWMIGELDQRRSEMIDGRRRPTAFGAMYDWMGKTSTRPAGTLVLSGKTGSGKDVAATYAAVHLGGEYYFAPNLGDLPLGQCPVLEHLQRVPFLVLCELGREPSLDTTRSRVVALLGTRHDNRRTTLITTNLPAETPDSDACFVGRYGKHLLNRVVTSGGYVELAGESRRQLGVLPKLTSITHHCRIADLVDAVNTLTKAADTDVSPSVIDLLAAEFGITEQQIVAAAARRREVFAIPPEFGGDFGRALRVAAGLEKPAATRELGVRDV